MWTIAVVTVAAIIVLLVGLRRRYPLINDVTTDPDDPPQFVAAPYPGRDACVWAGQRDSYPDIVPISLQDEPGAAFRRVMAVVQGLGWEVVDQDAAAGFLRAVDRTTVFRFIDDVAVRVRPGADGSIVDVRSRSRVGRGDLGANARRIRRFRARLAATERGRGLA